MTTRIRPGGLATVVILGVVLVTVVMLTYSNNNPIATIINYGDSGSHGMGGDPSLKFPRQVQPLNIPLTEVARIRAIADRYDRLKAIYDAIPPARQWPDDLGYGFKTIKNPLHNNKITPDMKPEEAENEFYKFVQRFHINCPNITRFGSAGGGGWDVCLAGPFDIKKPCLIYSVGMGGEWSFDKAIMARGCADFAFDPTLGKENYKPEALMWFHNIGMAGINGINAQKWQVRTFGGMLEELGHTHAVVDILKVDIEYSEWEALETMFLEGSMANVKQFIWEYHTDDLVKKDSGPKDFAYFWLMWQTLDKLGFKYWAYETNKDGRWKSKVTQQVRDCCANVYFVNANLLVKS